MEHPNSYVFPWDEGAKRSYGWILLISWLLFGAIVNVIQLLLHFFIPKLHKQPCCRIIIWLSSVDFAFDFICLIQCSLSYRVKAFFGEQLFCTAQAFWAELLMAMSGFSIGCTMLASYMAIMHNRVLTRKEIDRLHIGALIYCALLAFLGSIKPGEGTLNSSGLFCYTASQFAFEGILFHFGYVAPLISTLIFFWYRMYKRVKEMTQFLIKRKINAEARKGQVAMAKRMAWYIYILLLCFVPYELAVWYSWITGHHAPYQMWITFGMFGHILTVASPILYYVLNQSARDAVKEAFSRCFRNSQQRDIELSSSVSGRRLSQSASASSPSRHHIGDKQLEELTNALSDPTLLNEMLAYADAHWCSEGVLFWIDVQVWRTMLTKHSSLISSPSDMSRSPSFQTAEDVKEKEELPILQAVVVESKQLIELREFATNVYLTYFVRGAHGCAPLELNISDELQQKIVKQLQVELGQDGKVHSNFEYSSDLIQLFDPAEKECLRLLYDNVYTPFCNKINMSEVVSTQQRLKSFSSGDALPGFQEASNSSEIHGQNLAASVIIPSNTSGGVSTAYSTKRSRTYVGGSDREDSISTENNSRENSTSRPRSEILHVGLDTSASLRVIFREQGSRQQSAGNSPSLTYGTSEQVHVPPMSLSPIGENQTSEKKKNFF